MSRCLIAIFALATLGFGLAQNATVDMRDCSIGAILTDAEQVSILSLMVDVVGLDETLRTGGPFTVFAPVDRAWLALDTETFHGLLRNPEARETVLLYHVVPGSVDSGQLFDRLLADAGRRIGDENPPDAELENPVDALLATGVTSAVMFETLQGAMIEVTAGRTTDTTIHGGHQIGAGDALLGIAEPLAALRVEGVGLMVDDANFLSLDIVASNGVIHLIDRMLVPEGFARPN